MTLIPFTGGKPVMRDGKIGTEQACCCGGGNKRCAKCYPPPYFCFKSFPNCYKDGSPFYKNGAYDPNDDFETCNECYAAGGDSCEYYQTGAGAGSNPPGSPYVNDCSECGNGINGGYPGGNNDANSDCNKYCSFFDVTSCAECLSLNDNAEMTASLADGTPGPWVYECDEPQVFP